MDNENNIAVELLFCYNCYTSNHISKNCPHPICSYGVVCYSLCQQKNVENDPTPKFYDDTNIIPHYDDNTNKIQQDIQGIKSNMMVEQKQIKYLMVERKHSFAFVDFLMGKYYILDYKYLQKLFNRMTLYERCLINSHNFKHLWHRLWNGKEYKKKSLQKDFWKASIKFYILKNGFISIDTQKQYKLSYLIENCNENYRTPEWYFPKGKLAHKYELPKQCALREFEEETNIPSIHIELIDINDYDMTNDNVNTNNDNITVNNKNNATNDNKNTNNDKNMTNDNENNDKNMTNHNVNRINQKHKFEEKHTAYNGKTYKVLFYIAKYIGSTKNGHNGTKNGTKYRIAMYDKKQEFLNKQNEIAAVDWLTYNECMKKFRPYEHEKLELLKMVHSNINKIINI